MLAIQRPRMGSSQPPDPNLPFGYSFDANNDLFPEPPPQPARGEPLLSDNDSKSLGSFFDFVSADPFNTTSFGEGLNFSDSWFADIPPQFVGSHSSLGPPSLSPSHIGLTANHDFGDILGGSSLMPPPPPPPAPQQHSPTIHGQPSPQQHATADVLAAATLLRTGAASRTSNGHRDVPRGIVPVGHLRHQGLDDFRQDSHKSLQQGSQPNEHDTHFTDMFFGAGDRLSMPSRRAHVGDVQWGSDAAFSQGSGYVPRSINETYEAMAKRQNDFIQCLEVSQSGTNTCPPSPVSGERSPTKSHSRKTSELAGKANDPDGPPRKRRKSRVKADLDDDDDDDDSPTPKPGRRRKSKLDDSPSINGSTLEKGSTPSKRRKSTTGAKPPRENLSEEQKRENHIRSEQKRRTLIKEGFADLVSIVPDLRDGGFSKSAMLSAASDWLESLLEYNKQLSLHVAALKAT